MRDRAPATLASRAHHPAQAPARASKLPRGFTLVEVLVALVIVAIGMSAVLSAIGSSADTAAYLRDKTLAEWIALNQLTQTRLQTQMPAKGGTDGELDYAGRHWRWHQEVVDGGFPGILRIDVTVQQPDTAAGKGASSIASVSGAMGNTVLRQQTASVYNEFAQLPPGSDGGTTPSTTGGTRLGSR